MVYVCARRQAKIVRPGRGGPWDFKHHYGSQYEDYGNFHYGAVGKAFGGEWWPFFTEFQIYNEAGIAQYSGSTRGGADWGRPASRVCYTGGCRSYVAGKIPYGDDPWDRYWIGRGIKYYNGKK